MASVKSLATLIKLQKQRVDEQRLVVARLREHLEQIIAQIEAIKQEQEDQKSLVDRNTSFGMTYGDYLKESLKKIEALEKKKKNAERAVQIAFEKLAELFEEQKRYEIAQKNRLEEEEREEQRRETHTLDEVGSVGFIRRKRKGAS